MYMYYIKKIINTFNNKQQITINIVNNTGDDKLVINRNPTTYDITKTKELLITVSDRILLKLERCQNSQI